MTNNAASESACWETRAALYELLALSFRYPDDVLVKTLASGEWTEAANEIADALGLQGFAAASCRYEGVDADALLHRLRAEATRLFVGAPDPAVSPYEGVWRAADDGVTPLLFVNPRSMEVERFMKSCGLGRPEGTSEPLDHLVAECELLQYLASLAAGVILPLDAPMTLDLPGGSPAAAYEMFLADHACTWIPRLANAVIVESRQPFYRTAAQLLKEAVALPALSI